MHNPYNVGNWVSRPHFYGRSTLVADVLRDDRHCTYLMGTRRIGKTSLLRDLEARGPAVGLFINLQLCATGPEGRLDSAHVARLIKRELAVKARKHHILAQLHVRVEHAPTLCDTVQELAWAVDEYDTPVVLLWDETEKLLDLRRNELEPLRGILQDSPALRTVIAATKGLSELNDRCRAWGTSPFLFGFVTRPVGVLDDDEAVALMCQQDHPDGPVRVDDSLVTEIVALCGNHPFLIQRLCEKLYQRDRSLRSPTEVDLVVDGQLADFLANDFAQLSEGEQRLMQSLGRRAPQSEAQLQRSTRIGSEQVRSFLLGMEQLAYIRRRADGGYEPGNIFLSKWLKMRSAESATPHVSDRASLEVIDEDHQHLQELRFTYKRRLQALERRAALEGVTLDPSVSIEIENLRAEVQRLNDLLGLPTELSSL